MKRYSAAMMEFGPANSQEVRRRINNRSQKSQLTYWRREQATFQFKRVSNLRYFPSTDASSPNHVNLERHLNSEARFKRNRDTALIERRQLLLAYRRRQPPSGNTQIAALPKIDAGLTQVAEYRS